MKEIKFSFDEDNGEKKDGKEAEVIDLSEYREFVLSLCTGTASEYAADHFVYE